MREEECLPFERKSEGLGRVHRGTHYDRDLRDRVVSRERPGGVRNRT